MVKLRIEDCNDAAFREVAPRLREEDQTEWRVAVGDTPANLYASGSYRLPAGPGTLNRIAYASDGVPLAVWGVSPAYPAKSYHHGKVGWVWLVATPEAVPQALALHRNLTAEFGRLKGLYPKLITASYLRNPVHHEWLRWLGFTEQSGRVITAYGGVFVPFTYGEA